MNFEQAGIRFGYLPFSLHSIALPASLFCVPRRLGLRRRASHRAACPLPCPCAAAVVRVCFLLGVVVVVRLCVLSVGVAINVVGA